MHAGPEGQETERPTRRFPRSRVSTAERGRMREEIRKVDFPMGLRGYDRAAVDRYVQQVNRLIAELEISSSPESAIRHALEEVGEETRDLLQRAHETADEITARSRAKADDRLQGALREAEEVRSAASGEAEEVRDSAVREAEELRASAAREALETRETLRREMHELRERTARETEHVRATAQREVDELRIAAETRLQELDRDTAAIERERLRLIEDMSALARQHLEIADAAAERFPGRPEQPAPLESEEQPTQVTEPAVADPEPEQARAGDQ
jgi:DivIVA domain-containing protein